MSQTDFYWSSVAVDEGSQFLTDITWAAMHEEVGVKKSSTRRGPGKSFGFELSADMARRQRAVFLWL